MTSPLISVREVVLGGYRAPQSTACDSGGKERAHEQVE